MRRAVLPLAVLLLALAPAVAAQTLPRIGTEMRTHVATLDGAPEAIAMRLGRRLDAEAQPRELGDGSVLIAYAGTNLPRPLAAFLTDTMPELDPERLKPGLPVNLNLILLPGSDGGTDVRLMMVESRRPGDADPTRARFAEAFDAPMPEGAQVILSEGAGGNIVMTHPEDAETAAGSYTAMLEAAGYRVTRSGRGDALLMAENQTGGAALVFVRPDPDSPDRALVVVRILEE